MIIDRSRAVRNGRDDATARNCDGARNHTGLICIDAVASNASTLTDHHLEFSSEQRLRNCATDGVSMGRLPATRLYQSREGITTTTHESFFSFAFSSTL